MYPTLLADLMFPGEAETRLVILSSKCSGQHRLTNAQTILRIDTL